MKAGLREEAHTHPGKTIIVAMPWWSGRNAKPIDQQADNRDTRGLPMRIPTMNTEKNHRPRLWIGWPLPDNAVAP